MRTTVLAVVVLTAFSLCAQDGPGDHITATAKAIWAGLDTRPPDPRPPPASLSGSQQKAVRQAIHSHAKLDGLEDCDQYEPNGAWLEKISFETIAVTGSRQVVLAESGPGCARGGQGSNGAMWIVAVDDAKPVLLATPQDGFKGFTRCSPTRARASMT